MQEGTGQFQSAPRIKSDQLTSKNVHAMAYRGGGLGCSNPPPEIPKALQNRAKQPDCENC